MLNIDKASRTICNGIWHKSQQLQFKIVSVDPTWNILTCASQNMNEEKSKLVAVKITQTYTQLMKRQSSSQSSPFLDNSSTLLFILDNCMSDNSALKIGNICWLVLFPDFPACVRKKVSVKR